MKVVGICGSLAKNSMNLKFLKGAMDLLPGEHEREILGLEGIPIYHPDLSEQPEAVKGFCGKIAEADRIIIATPEYNYSVPGVLKNALDWASRDPSQPFKGKITAIMGASPGNIGTARCQYHLRQIGVFLDMRFINKPEVMIGTGHQKLADDGNITDEKTREQLRLMLNSLLA